MSSPVKTVAITGPHGVLGRHVQVRLKEAGLEVMPTGRDRWDLQQFKSPEQLDLVFSEADAVIHLGAMVPIPGHLQDQDRNQMCDTNVRACAALGTWAAARRIPVIYAGTAGIYETDVAAATEDAPLRSCPHGGFYGLTKLLGESMLIGLQAEGLQLCVLRMSSIYGAGLNPSKIVAKMLATAVAGATIHLHQPVDDCVNLIHASDVANAVWLALQRNARGVFNIAGPGLVSMVDLAKNCIATAGGGTIEIGAKIGGRPPMRQFDVSCRKAAVHLDYHPQIQLRDGLVLMREHRYV